MGDLFRRKAKDATASKDERAHKTIGAMERGALEHMNKTGHLPGGAAQSPLRAHSPGGLPSVPSALRHSDIAAGTTPGQPSALPTAAPKPEWVLKNPGKPGAFLRVLWKRDKATRANFAWWDSFDGVHGGKMLRVGVLESDRRAINEFDLFPRGEQAQQLLNVVTSSEQTLEFPYVTYSFLSADEQGPPGMVFVAPPGVQFPVDAVWVKPAIEKLLERKQIEAQRLADELQMAKTEQSIRDIKIAVERREKLERRGKLESKLKRMLSCARQTRVVASNEGSTSLPPPGFKDEHAVWTQLSPAGLPPPPQKHPIAILYEFEVEKRLTFDGKQQKSDGKDQPESDSETSLLGLVLTLEVWSHTFNERYNIFLGAKNAINHAEMRLETLGFPILKWQRTHVFDAHVAPSVRDSPGLCYDGKGGLLFFGGKTKGGDYKTYFNDLWRFDYNKNRWQMYKESVRTYDKGWKQTVGMQGKKPTSRSSSTMLFRKEVSGGTAGIEEDTLYISGGSDRQGKCGDVRKIVIDEESSNHLRWNELISNRRATVEGDIVVEGTAPGRGFCAKCLSTRTAIYAPQLGDGEIMQLALDAKQWKTLKFDKFVAWRTSKLLCADFEVMTRFVSVDFKSSTETGFPGIETAEAWNIYTQADEKDNRENAEKSWLLCPGQVMMFQSLASFGDKPGTWSAQTLSKGVINQRGQPYTRFYCFGGCRLEGKISLAALPEDYCQPQIVAKDQNPRVGMRVKATAAFWQRVARERRAMNLDASTTFTTAAFGSLARMSSTESKDPVEFPQAMTNVVTRVAESLPTNDINDDVIGVITQIRDEEDHVDEIGRITIRKTDQVTVSVKFDGHETDLVCSCGKDGVFDLIEFVDYDLYSANGGRGITNELWTLDVKESMQLTQLCRRFEELKRVRGHTDEFSLTQVLGKRIKIEDWRRAQNQGRPAGLTRGNSLAKFP